MKRALAVPQVVLILALSFFVTVGVQGQQAADYVQDQVIIKFKPNTSQNEIAAVQSSLGAAVDSRFYRIRAELWNISSMTVQDAINLYQNDPRVQYIEPNYYVYADDTFPNDPRFNEMWGLHNTGQTGGTPDADIDAPEGWDFETGKEILVGDIDTGTDWQHQDLADNIYINPNEIPNNGIDDDGNGFIDDVRGWDFVNNDNNPTDDNGHGTHTAGTIGAVGNNGIGVVGVSWKVKIMPVKFLGASGSGTTANAIKSVEYTTMMGMQLTNNSWGGGGFSQALKDAIEDAGANGILFVAAAGNQGSDTDLFPHYPSSYDSDNIISVANTNHNDGLSGTSNWGLTTVDLGAPGSAILSTFPGNSYGTASGTSMASPHVAGAVSLLWSAVPTMPHLDVKATIMDNVDIIPALQGRTVSGGRLNIYNFLSKLDSIPPGKITDLTVASTSSNTATLAWTAVGDDGYTGTATRYDIRYSTRQIYWSSFDQATPVPNPPTPQPAGTPETFEVWGLDYNTQYSFAIKVYDEQDNVSFISNLPLGTTLGIPQLAYAPTSLTDNLFTGGTSTQVLTLENVGDGTLDYSFSSLPAWLTVAPETGRVNAGESDQADFVFDATGLLGGVYTANVVIHTNDPAQLSVNLLVTLIVTEAADISVSPEQLDFGPQYIGTTKTLSLIVTNDGVIPLNVSGVSIDNPEFYVDPSGFILMPTASHTLLVEYTPTIEGPVSGTLSISSDDPYTPQLGVPLDGVGVVPPEISISPSSFTDTLWTGATSSQIMTISNTGGSDLDFEIHIEPVDSIVAAFFAALQPPALEGLAAEDHSVHLKSYESFASNGGAHNNPGAFSLPPADQRVLDFYALVEGTLLDSTLVFFDDMESGPNGWTHYSTHPNGDDQWAMSTVRSHSPTTSWRVEQHASYGSDALQSPDIDLTNYDNASLVFKHWYNFDDCGGDPTFEADGGLVEISVNGGASWTQITPVGGYPYILDDICDNPLAYRPAYSHDGGNGNLFIPAVFDLTPWAGNVITIRFHAGWDCGNCENNEGWYIDDVAVYTRGVMWLTADPPTGTVAANSSLDVDMIFNAAGLDGGDYRSDIIVSSNDLDEPELSVPAYLHVIGAPDISVSDDLLAYGQVYIGATKKDTLVVRNAGTDVLVVNNVTTDHSDYSVDITSFVLNPGQTQNIEVSFSPTTAAVILGTLTIYSNDPDEPTVDVALEGEGVVPPVISVTPSSFSDSLYTGESASHVMTISNGGGSNLDFEITTEESDSTAGMWMTTHINIPPSDGNFPRGSYAPSTGMAPENGVPTAPAPSAPTITSTGGSSFATETQNLLFVSFSLNLPEVLNNLGSAPEFIWAGDFGLGDNSFAYAVSDLNEFMQIDTTTGTQTVLGTLSPFGLETFTGMAVDPTDGKMYLSSTDISASSLYEVDIQAVTATRIGSIGMPGIIAIAVDGQGDMYAHDIVTDELVRIDKTTGAGTPIGSLGYDANFGQGMAWDPASGELYLAAFNNATFVAELRIADRTTGATTLVGVLGGTTPGGTNQLGWVAIPGGGVPWLSVDPNTGTVPPGMSMDVDVLFDASGQFGGDYNADIIIANNDPLNSELPVPAFMHVTGAPDWAVSDSMLAFGQEFIGGTKTLPLTVENIGTDLLTINSVSSDNPDFTVDVASFNLNPGESQVIQVSFSPTTVAVIQGTLTLQSNDPDEPIVYVALEGEGLVPPVISVTPSSFSDSLYTGESASHVMTISNSGGNDLVWEIDIREDTTVVLAVAPAGVSPAERPDLSAYAREIPADVLSRTGSYDGETVSSEARSTSSPAQAEILVLTTTSVGGSIETALNNLGQPYDLINTSDFTGIDYSPYTTIIVGMDGGSVNEASVQTIANEAAGGKSLIMVGGTNSGPFYNGVQMYLVSHTGQTGWTTSSTPHLIVTDPSHALSTDLPATVTFANTSASYYMLRVNDPAIEQAAINGDNYPDLFAKAIGDGRLIWFLNSPYSSYWSDPADFAIMQTVIRNALEYSPVKWLSATPKSGTLPPGGAVDVDVLFDANGLNGGDYNADLVVLNNDPLNSEYTVPTYLHVTGAPDWTVSETLLSFGQVFIGGTALDTVEVKNVGTDLLVVSSVATNHPDYTVDVSNFNLNPGESRDIQVAFSPTTASVILGTLTLQSNDPDEPAVYVALEGEGLVPPVVSVTPASLSDSLFTGETSVHLMTISNSGGSNLEFDIAALPTDSAVSMQEYTLTVPSSENLYNDGVPVTDVTGRRTTAITATLQDLTGVVVMWDNAHGQGGPSSWSTIMADLVARGATIVTNTSTITPTVLEGVDVVWTIDMGQWQQIEIVALSDWVHGGGGVIFESDQSVDAINQILVAMGSGIVLSPNAAGNGLTTNIFPHQTTENVNSVNIAGSLASIQSATPPAGLLFNDANNVYGAGGYDNVQAGRVIAVTDELFGDFAIAGGDNQLLANQVIDWLASGVSWLSFTPVSGIVPPAASVDVDVLFDAASLNGGDYFSDIVVANNDPLNPEWVVPAYLNVTGAPNIEVSDTVFAFGQVFLGGTALDTLVVENTGTDMLVVSSVATDHPDYAVDVASFNLNPGESQDILVSFTPTTAAVILGTLTIQSNDPDEATVEIALEGEGLEAPIISVAPDSMSESLFTGDILTRQLTIVNSGGSNLNWEIRIASTVAEQEYTLTVPDIKNVTTNDGVQVGEMPYVRTTPITAMLQDLTDVDIMWDMSHGQGSSAGWSTIMADLTARGATVTENLNPITPALLDNYDIVWLTDMGSWTPSELAYITAWVHAGGGILFESDQSVTTVNDILASLGTGIVMSSTSGTNGLTSYIFPHETTQNVNSVNIAGSLASLPQIAPPGGRLVNDISNMGACAYSDVQAGRVVVLNDELFGNFAIAGGDNQLFANQVIDWLAEGVAWLSVNPNVGTTPAGGADTVDVVFDATSINPNDYTANIVVDNNDPVSPQVVIPVTFEVIGASNIEVSETVLEFGPVIIGDTKTLSLIVSNTGNDDLVVSDISADNTDFLAVPASFTVLPGGNRTVQVSYSPSLDGPVTATLTITSNDPDEGQLPIALLGEGLIPPQVAVSPDSLEDDLLSGQTSVHTLTISNAGGSDLVFDIQKVETAGAAAVSDPLSMREPNTGDRDIQSRRPIPTREASKGDPVIVPVSPESPVVTITELEEINTSAPVAWILLSQTTGSVPPGGSLDIQVTFDATNLFGGLYTADLRIQTNIPNAPAVVIPTTLSVTGVPNIVVADTLLDFDTVYIGYPETKALVVFNLGTDVLTVTNIAVDEPEFTATPTSFQVGVGANQVVEVTYDPASAGPAAAVLTITSDDPDQSTLGVDLVGEALEPPIVTTSVDSLDIVVPEGQTVVENFVLGNAGGSDLEWAIDVGFTANAPLQMASALSGDPSSKESGSAEPEMERSAAAFFKILWYGDHGLGGIALWSTIVNDLLARGATVTESSDPITPALLSGYNVLWFGDAVDPLTADERAAIVTWVNNGGNMLMEADNDIAVSSYSQLLGDLQAGLYFLSPDGFPGLTANIYPHVTTAGVSTLYLLNPSAHMNASPPGGNLFNDLVGLPMGTYSEVGDGRIVAISDQVFHDVAINNGDNRLFANQVFSWLAFGGFQWLTVTPTSGILGSGADVQVNLEIDGSLLPTGAFDITLNVLSNDPANPVVTIPTHVVVDSAVTVTGLNDQVPTRYELHPNYPNPFNPTTTISYDLPAPVSVRLVIYNVRGEKVKELVNAEQPAGRHKVVWDGRNSHGETVATGIYLYKIVAGEFVSTRKMTLLK